MGVKPSDPALLCRTGRGSLTAEAEGAEKGHGKRQPVTEKGRQVKKLIDTNGGTTAESYTRKGKGESLMRLVKKKIGKQRRRSS